MKRFLPFSALALLAATPALAQQGTTGRQSEAYQASVTQDGLRRDAASVRTELVNLREQMRELLPEDVATVDRAIQQLDSLSKEDMERVIQTLRGASQPTALTGEAKALADALREQGTISTSLKKLAVSLDARQSMEGIAEELSGLLQRQVAARDELLRISRKDPTPDRLHGHDHERWEVVNDDQHHLNEDLKLLLPKIERLASALTGPAQERFTKAVAVARDGKLAVLADQAAAGTAQGPFDQAANAQAGIVSVLVSMEAALSDAKLAERLTALETKLKQTLEQQQTITALIATFHERQSVESDTKRLQMNLSDQTALLKAELQGLNAQAAGQLDAAQEATETASLHYERMWEERPEAQQSTRDTVADMQAAVQALDKQIASLPNRTPVSAQQLDAALAALQRDVGQAAAAAQNLAMATTPPTNPDQEKALAAAVADLQQRALTLSPDAAQELSNAAADLKQPGKPGEQAAAQQLATAQKALAQQQAALEGRTPGQLALAQAEAQAAQAQQALAQQQQNLDSDKTAADAVTGLDAARQEIANAQRTAAQAGAPADAQQALATAAQDIAQAQSDAAQTKLGQAQADAKAGQQALARAQQGMEAARQAQAQQAASAMAANKGNDPGPRQTVGGTPQGQGNGGGGKSGDNLAGSGNSAERLAPVSGLTPKDREAVAQLQTEKPPAEFLSEVQQYYKNIADGAGL